MLMFIYVRTIFLKSRLNWTFDSKARLISVVPTLTHPPHYGDEFDSVHHSAQYEPIPANVDEEEFSVLDASCLETTETGTETQPSQVQLLRSLAADYTNASNNLGGKCNYIILYNNN